jgi:hypothetical protein
LESNIKRIGLSITSHGILERILLPLFHQERPIVVKRFCGWRIHVKVDLVSGLHQFRLFMFDFDFGVVIMIGWRTFIKEPLGV